MAGTILYLLLLLLFNYLMAGTSAEVRDYAQGPIYC